MSDFEITTVSEMFEIKESNGEMTKEYFDHIKKVNDIFYDQIKISDQKAAYIFTFMLAFMITSSEGRGVFTWSRYMDGDAVRIALSALLAIASMFSILAAILVVLPRRVGKSTSLFWGAWPQHREGFRKAAGEQDRNYLFHQYLENADTLSVIACNKYRCVAFAFRGLIVTVLAYVLLLIGM